MLRAPSFTRPKFSTLKATLCPCPIVPSTFSTGTLTLSSISAVVEFQLECVAAADDAERALDETGGELIAVDLREHRDQVRELAVGDPHLLAVEQIEPPVCAQGRRGARGERVGARLRFRERIGA